MYDPIEWFFNIYNYKYRFNTFELNCYRTHVDNPQKRKILAILDNNKAVDDNRLKLISERILK